MTATTSSSPTLTQRFPTRISAAGWLRRVLVARDATPLPICFVTASLCLAVAVIHVQDQGGFLGDVSPAWIAIGYYLIESVATVTALLFVRQQVIAWVLGLGVSAAPAIAYILTRTVGLPGDTADIGNWGYTLGVVSLIVEGALFVLCVVALTRIATRLRRQWAVVAYATTVR